MPEVNAETLTRLVERGDGLWEDRKEVNGRFGELYQEVRDAGLNVGTFRQILSERQMDRDALRERLERLTQYRASLGMFAETPLGAAAVEREAAPKPKSFAAQPVKRGRGRPRKNGAEGAISRGRIHFGFDDDLPPAA